MQDDEKNIMRTLKKKIAPNGHPGLQLRRRLLQLGDPHEFRADGGSGHRQHALRPLDEVQLARVLLVGGAGLHPGGRRSGGSPGALLSLGRDMMKKLILDNTLTRECQSISYDAMSAWVSVVFARYVMLAYLNRLDVDERTTGIVAPK